jgi:mono/diheme cytochrome c family protein
MKRIGQICITTILGFAFAAMFIIASRAEGTKSGAKVYEQNCGRCHAEPSPKGRSDKAWRVIVTQMRVRANLTADEARDVLEFLQENN